MASRQMLEVTKNALQNNTEFIVPQGESLTLIMDERKNLGDIIAPMKPSPSPPGSSKKMTGSQKEQY